MGHQIHRKVSAKLSRIGQCSLGGKWSWVWIGCGSGLLSLCSAAYRTPISVPSLSRNQSQAQEISMSKVSVMFLYFPFDNNIVYRELFQLSENS